MKLSEYLDQPGMSQAKFAQAIGVTQSAVSQWLQWLGDPTRRQGSKVTAERALDIERATAGAVTRHDVRPDIYGSAPEKSEAA